MILDNLSRLTGLSAFSNISKTIPGTNDTRNISRYFDVIFFFNGFQVVIENKLQSSP